MRVPIITYHAIGSVASPLWTPEHVFEAQLAAFAKQGYQTISLADLAAHLRHRELLPDNLLVITFDDGYESVYQQALPLLQQYGFTATVFLITDYCDYTNQWVGQPASVPITPLLKWKQIETLSAEGWELGAHTRSHAALSTLTVEAATEEVLASQQVIQARTGQLARCFAYPYGATNAAVTAIVQQHFEAAVGTDLGLVQADAHLYSLTRIDSYYLTSGWIPHLHSTLFQHYLSLRQRLRSVRRNFRPDWQPAATQTING